MSRSIQIPSTVEALRAKATESVRVEALIGWERAAWVHAFCSPGKTGFRRDAHVHTHLFPSFRALAEEKIPGLCGDTYVAWHWKNWQDAINRGVAQPVAPGESVNVPDEPYPMNPVRNPVHDAFLKDADPDDTKRVIVERMKDNPALASAVVREAMDAVPEVAEQVENAFVQRAAHEPELWNRVRREAYGDVPYAEERILVAPPPPRAVLGFGAEVYGRVRDCTPLLQGYLASLDQRQGRPYLDEEIEEEDAALEKSQALIAEYRSALRSKKSTDYDATFARLIGRQA